MSYRVYFFVLFFFFFLHCLLLASTVLLLQLRFLGSGNNPGSEGTMLSLPGNINRTNSPVYCSCLQLNQFLSLSPSVLFFVCLFVCFILSCQSPHLPTTVSFSYLYKVYLLELLFAWLCLLSGLGTTLTGHPGTVSG